MSRRLIVIASLIAAAALAVACQSATPTQPAPSAGLANPASTYCTGLKYDLQIRSDSSGAQTGYCVFPDKTECEEWAFFRGECGQDKSFCATNGGKIEKTENGAICTFPDGSTCPEVDFAAGTCKPGNK
jgi:putative hemolysin